jgi:hypothetical protein
VSVIDGTTNTVTATIDMGDNPMVGVAVDPVTHNPYVGNYGSDTVSAISSNTTLIVGTDNTGVAIAEGQTATNTGSFSDAEGDSVTFKYVVVYASSTGLVTSGGWINSPAGAYKADPTLTGKATFGFVSKYRKGATVPSGNTEVQFQAGWFNFHSDTYDWLMVNQGGDNAQFKGSGTVNGTLDSNLNPYKFMLWAGDGSPDTFRIKIWSENTSGVETVVYDNGFDQAIGGGSIVMHK